MSRFSNLNPNYGQGIHRRMAESVADQSNNLLVGTGRKILRMLGEGTPGAYYLRKLDGITWKEDLNLVATSVVWSIVPLITNIVALPFEIAFTLLSGVVLCLSSILLAPFYRHIPYGSRNNGYLKTAGTNFTMGLAVMTIGTLFTLLSSVIDIIRAIPFVGHALRMGYKLIDGQYKNPCASTDDSDGDDFSAGADVDGGGLISGEAAAASMSYKTTNSQYEKRCTSTGDSNCGEHTRRAAAPIVSPSDSQPAPIFMLRHTPFQRIFNNLFGSGFSYMRYLFSRHQKATTSIDQQIGINREKLVDLYKANFDLMAELSLGNASLGDNDLIRFCDLMSALHQNKEHKSGESNTLYFNAQSTGHVNALDFIVNTINNIEFIEQLKNGFENHPFKEVLNKLITELQAAKNDYNDHHQSDSVQPESLQPSYASHNAANRPTSRNARATEGSETPQLMMI